jgi:thiamine biosynthesis lipoprotein
MTLALVSRFSHQAMGTFFEVNIAGEESTYAEQAARAAFKEIDRLESLFSRFDATSEISRLNRLGPGESIAVGIETFECLTIAERVREETGGAFDVNVRGRNPVSEDGGPAPAPAAFRLSKTSSGFEAGRAEASSGGCARLDLDLGGIGKGYALDRTMAVLAEWSIGNVLVHGGTSTAVAVGSAPGARGWPVGVGGGWPCPDAPREMMLSGRALSGSGTDVKGQHIIDPRTGAPAKGHVAAWALHPDAAGADALSTAFMVMKTENVENFCLRHPEVWALVVIDYGECRMFGNLR